MIKINFIGCVLVFVLVGCGENNKANRVFTSTEAKRSQTLEGVNEDLRSGKKREKITDLFKSSADSHAVGGVNKHLWAASLEVLNFLPLEIADPISGVISFGWGQSPGAKEQYRATVHIRNVALDATSLRLALYRRDKNNSIAVNKQIHDQIENAILTRARQLRIQEKS